MSAGNGSEKGGEVSNGWKGSVEGSRWIQGKGRTGLGVRKPVLRSGGTGSKAWCKGSRCLLGRLAWGNRLPPSGHFSPVALEASGLGGFLEAQEVEKFLDAAGVGAEVAFSFA